MTLEISEITVKFFVLYFVPLPTGNDARESLQGPRSYPEDVQLGLTFRVTALALPSAFPG